MDLVFLFLFVLLCFRIVYALLVRCYMPICWFSRVSCYVRTCNLHIMSWDHFINAQQQRERERESWSSQHSKYYATEYKQSYHLFIFHNLFPYSQIVNTSNKRILFRLLFVFVVERKCAHSTFDWLSYIVCYRSDDNTPPSTVQEIIMKYIHMRARNLHTSNARDRVFNWLRVNICESNVHE